MNDNDFFTSLFLLVVVTLVILVELGRSFRSSPVVGFSPEFPYVLTPLIVIFACPIVTLITWQLAEPSEDEFSPSIGFLIAGVLIFFGAVQTFNGIDLVIKLVFYWVSMLLVAFAVYLATPT